MYLSWKSRSTLSDNEMHASELCVTQRYELSTGHIIVAIRTNTVNMALKENANMEFSAAFIFDARKKERFTLACAARRFV